MTNAQEKRIVRFALYGAVGFGIGGLIGMALVEVAGENLLLGFVGLATIGPLGGAALGLALKRKVVALALLGVIGFLIGLFFGPLASGTILGAIGGTALGLALWGWRDWRQIIGLALAGAIGFGIGWTIFSATSLDFWLGWPLTAIIGGASLGTAVGYLEKGREEERPPKAAIPEEPPPEAVTLKEPSA